MKGSREVIDLAHPPTPPRLAIVEEAPAKPSLRWWIPYHEPGRVVRREHQKYYRSSAVPWKNWVKEMRDNRESSLWYADVNPHWFIDAPPIHDELFWGDPEEAVKLLEGSVKGLKDTSVLSGPPDGQKNTMTVGQWKHLDEVADVGGTRPTVLMQWARTLQYYCESVKPLFYRGKKYGCFSMMFVSEEEWKKKLETYDVIVSFLSFKVLADVQTKKIADPVERRKQDARRHVICLRMTKMGGRLGNGWPMFRIETFDSAGALRFPAWQMPDVIEWHGSKIVKDDTQAPFQVVKATTPFSGQEELPFHVASFAQLLLTERLYGDQNLLIQRMLGLQRAKPFTRLSDPKMVKAWEDGFLARGQVKCHNLNYQLGGTCGIHTAYNMWYFMCNPASQYRLPPRIDAKQFAKFMQWMLGMMNNHRLSEWKGKHPTNGLGYF